MVERPSVVRDAAVLVGLEGAFHIFLAYWFYHFLRMYPEPYPFFVMVGNVMIVLGLLVFAVSLAVWLQKSWATKAIVGIGVVSCIALTIFGYYMLSIVIVVFSWAAIDCLRQHNEGRDR